MRFGTRWSRVLTFDAVVALATTASACSGVGAPPRVTRAETITVLRVEGSSTRVTIGPPCHATGLELCFNAIDDDCNGRVDEGCGAAFGALQIVVAWEESDVDLELRVVDPEGNEARVGDRTPLGLWKDRDCPGEGDGCGGQNSEAVAADSAPFGRYRIVVEPKRRAPISREVHVRLGGRFGRNSLVGEGILRAHEAPISVELLCSQKPMSAGPR